MTNPYIAATLHHRTGSDRGYDDLNVEIAVTRGSVVLRPAEIREVVRRLTRRGDSAAQVARHIGATTRTVERHRAVLRGCESS
jgi:FixJ family two-component response regulator